MNRRKLTDFEQDLQEHLKNPEFKKRFDEYGRQLEIAYTMLQLRKKKKLSQAELAKKVGTTQSNIARMEAGNQNFTLFTLMRVGQALGKKVEVRFI